MTSPIHDIEDERFWLVDDGDPEGRNWCVLDRDEDRVIAYFDDEEEGEAAVEALNDGALNPEDMPLY